VRSVSEWAEVRALAVDGVSQREIAARLGMNRRTVKRLAEAAEPPRYRRAPSGSMLDRLDPVLRKLVADFEDIKAPRVMELLREEYGYGGSVDLVRKRLAELRPKCERPAQKTGYRPGQVMQVDWAEMPTRPSVLGRERRVYALICALPFSGASTAHFTFDMTIESFLQGHVRAFDQERGSVTTGFIPPCIPSASSLALQAARSSVPDSLENRCGPFSRPRVRIPLRPVLKARSDDPVLVQGFRRIGEPRGAALARVSVGHPKPSLSAFRSPTVPGGGYQRAFATLTPRNAGAPARCMSFLTTAIVRPSPRR
jgi:hypothetical protein